MMETIQSYLEQAQTIALEWITSPAAIAQFGLLVVAFLAALFASRFIAPRLRRLIDPGDSETRIAQVRRFGLIFLPLLKLIRDRMRAGKTAS